ncbi:hypothetical protein NE237_015448 [Protea cynaroides]|uniref:Ubiquitin-like domain-containing protein n=1 Tax=Protea cynaroides TaxID=273540 RepID=A0A9Q0KE08_9MAGN|nr:hypothetical protein NE237_015448 [Protea cynaroides]
MIWKGLSLWIQRGIEVVEVLFGFPLKFFSSWLWEVRGFSIVSMASGSDDTGSASVNSNDEEINIFLKIKKTMAFKVKRWERIKDIKAKFQDKLGVSGKIQGFFLAGNELKDSQTLVDYYVQKNSTLHLVLQGATTVRMKLFVMLPPYRTTIVLETDPGDSVQNIKAMIQDKEGIPKNCFTLAYIGSNLDDSWTLAARNIQNEATVLVVLNPSDMMNISVRTLTEAYSSWTTACGWPLWLIIKSLKSLKYIWFQLYLLRFSIFAMESENGDTGLPSVSSDDEEVRKGKFPSATQDLYCSCTSPLQGK